MDSLCVGDESQETVKAVGPPPKQKERGTVVPLRAVAYCKEGDLLRDVPIFMSPAEVSAWFTSSCFQRGRKSVEAGEVQVKTLKVTPPGASLEEATPGSGAEAVERLWACGAQIRSSASKDLLYEASLFFNSRGILAGAGCSCPIAQRVADLDAGCMGQVRCKHACALMLRILDLRGQGAGGGGGGGGGASQFLGQSLTAKKAEVNFASQALKDGASPARKPQLVSKMSPTPRRAGKLHKYKEMTANQAANAFRRDTGDSPTDETDGPPLPASPTTPNSPVPFQLMEGDFSPPPNPDDPAPLAAPASPQRSPPMDDPTPPPSPPPPNHPSQTPHQIPENPQHPTTSSTPTLHFLHNPRPAAPFLSPTRPFTTGRSRLHQTGVGRPRGVEEGGGFPTHALPAGSAPASAPPARIDIMEEDEDIGESPLTLPNPIHLAPENGRRAFDPGVFESIAPELPKRPPRPRGPTNTTSVAAGKQPAPGSPARPQPRQTLPQTPPRVDITTGKWLKRTPKSCPRTTRPPPSAPSLALAPPSASTEKPNPEGSRPHSRKRQAPKLDRGEERPRKVPRGEPSLLFRPTSAPKEKWKGGLVEPSFGESLPADGTGADAAVGCEGVEAPGEGGAIGGETEQPDHTRDHRPAFADTAPERLDRGQDPGPLAPMVDRVLFSCGGDQDSSDDDGDGPLDAEACALFFSDGPAKAKPVTAPEEEGAKDSKEAPDLSSGPPERTTRAKQAALGLSGTVENVPFSLVLEEVRMHSAGMPARGRHQRSPPASPLRDRPSPRHRALGPSPSRSPSPRPSGGVPKVSLRALLGMA